MSLQVRFNIDEQEVDDDDDLIKSNLQYDPSIYDQFHFVNYFSKQIRSNGILKESIDCSSQG